MEEHMSAEPEGGCLEVISRLMLGVIMVIGVLLVLLG